MRGWRGLEKESHKHMSKKLVSEIKLPLADKSGRNHRLHHGCTSLCTV